MNKIDEKRVERLRKLAILMDGQFEGPFGVRIGLDGILGFIPFFGDFFTTIVSFYFLVVAAQLGATPSTLIRMSLNVIVENIIDLIPFVGSVFDIFWKSNERNMVILEAQLLSPKKTSFVSRMLVLLIILLILSLIFMLVYFSWMMFQFILGLLTFN